MSMIFIKKSSVYFLKSFFCVSSNLGDQLFFARCQIELRENHENGTIDAKNLGGKKKFQAVKMIAGLKSVELILTVRKLIIRFSQKITIKNVGFNMYLKSS